jgi:hypothetical protein
MLVTPAHLGLSLCRDLAALVIAALTASAPTITAGLPRISRSDLL